MSEYSIHKHWCGRRKRTSETDYQNLEQRPILLPLPTLSSALDIHPAAFSLPPSYQEALDLEKAVHAPQPQPQIWSKEHVPTYHFLTRTPGADLPQTRPAQEYIPPRQWLRIVRSLRYSVFTVYRRLFTLVFLLNGVGVFVFLRQRSRNVDKSISLDRLATLASSNFLLAILVRQDFFVNLLFRTAWLVPWNVPLRVRRMVARVYCYGGIHSGAAVAGTIWWIVFSGTMSWSFIQDRRYTFPILGLTWVVLLLLVVIILLAYPSIRARHHDMFEQTHRFLGWGSVALFWVQLLLLTHHTSVTLTPGQQSFGTVLLHNPTFWNLAVITSLLTYPWLRLRRWTFTAHSLSSHALQLSFPHKIHKFSCLSISSSPLREWHPFATFPSTDSQNVGASMIISDAGNWTRSLIREAHMRTAIAKGDEKEGTREGEDVKMSFYIKCHPKAGVLSLSCLFPRVLILTTGSGIGPCLSSLLETLPPPGDSRKQHARLLWSSRSPLLTYGPHILSLVSMADPNAVIIDTTITGRPDLLELAYAVCKRENMEAVFVLSNERVVRWVVGGLEKRGVVAFGPIWDS
jgi:hypothetical protein